MLTRTVPGKNPVHASALRIKDLTPGRRIVFCGPLDDYAHAVVVSRPTLGYDSGSEPLYPGEPKTLVVLVRYVDSGQLGSCGLEEIGVIPDASGKWGAKNYVVDARKEHAYLHPKSSLDLSQGQPGDVIGDDYDDEGHEAVQHWWEENPNHPAVHAADPYIYPEDIDVM